MVVPNISDAAYFALRKQVNGELSKAHALRSALLITPLKKLKDGVPYSRPQEIEQALEALSKLPIEEVARRASITDAKYAGYVPTECILHFVRKSKLNGDTAPYCDLFVILRNRVLGAVRRAIYAQLHREQQQNS